MSAASTPTTIWAAKHDCDILIHINSPTDPKIPSYGRIQGFKDCCREQDLRNELFFREFGHSYESVQPLLREILDKLDETYAGQKKGVFVSNDTLANTFLNLLFRKHGCLPADYLLVGFDNSPVSREAVVPISTVGQQIDKLAYEAVRLLVEQMNERKKRRPAPLLEPVHKVIAPTIFRRETTERE